jgi:hypothetical protein
MTYGINGATEDQFRDHKLATVYRIQLKTQTQDDGEYLQVFSTAIEQVTNHFFPAQCGDRISRGPIKAFNNGTRDKRCKTTARLMTQENTLQDPHTEPRAASRKAKSWAENGCQHIVEEPTGP